MYMYMYGQTTEVRFVFSFCLDMQRLYQRARIVQAKGAEQRLIEISQSIGSRCSVIECLYKSSRSPVYSCVKLDILYILLTFRYIRAHLDLMRSIFCTHASYAYTASESLIIIRYDFTK